VDKELFCPDQDPVFQDVSDPEHLPFKRQLNKLEVGSVQLLQDLLSIKKIL
jgi:hypothetical protein